MKKSSFLGLAALALIATVPLTSNTPALASWQEVKETIVQAVRRPQVKLNLTAAKKIVGQDAEGKKIVSWQKLGNKEAVMPGDVLRYIVSSNNAGNAPAANLVVTQPIPQGTIYILDSTTSKNETEITYSIDNGQTFVEKPKINVTLEDGTVEERPAPPEAYTHIRWKFGEAINPEAEVKVAYQVRVR